MKETQASKLKLKQIKAETSQEAFSLSSHRGLTENEAKRFTGNVKTDFW